MKPKLRFELFKYDPEVKTIWARPTQYTYQILFRNGWPIRNIKIGVVRKADDKR